MGAPSGRKKTRCLDRSAIDIKTSDTALMSALAISPERVPIAANHRSLALSPGASEEAMRERSENMDELLRSICGEMRAVGIEPNVDLLAAKVRAMFGTNDPIECYKLCFRLSELAVEAFAALLETAVQFDFTTERLHDIVHHNNAMFGLCSTLRRGIKSASVSSPVDFGVRALVRKDAERPEPPSAPAAPSSPRAQQLQVVPVSSPRVEIGKARKVIVLKSVPPAPSAPAVVDELLRFAGIDSSFDREEDRSDEERIEGEERSSDLTWMRDLFVFFRSVLSATAATTTAARSVTTRKS